MNTFEEVAMQLASLQAKVGELSMQIADLTVQIDSVASNEAESYIQRREELNSILLKYQAEVREVMKQMEKLAQG